MPSTVRIYYDVVSPYSYLGFLSCVAYKERWAAKGVNFEFIPFLLGGVMAASENQPPATNKFKGKYMMGDLQRMKSFYNMPSGFRFPDSFPSNSILPQRILTSLLLANDHERLIKLSLKFWDQYWSKNIDFSPDGIKSALSPYFSPQESTLLLQKAGSDLVKDTLKKHTREAVESGAFGAPWFVVTRADGKQQVFFGSDRFEAIAHFLGMPYIGPNPSAAAAAKL